MVSRYRQVYIDGPNDAYVDISDRVVLWQGPSHRCPSPARPLSAGLRLHRAREGEEGLKFDPNNAVRILIPTMLLGSWTRGCRRWV